MPVDLDEVREMLASLHSGPYWWERRGPDGATWTLYAPNTIPGVEPPFNEGHPYNLLNTDASEWDATGEALRALIAAAPELLAQLADECAALREENKRAWEMIASMNRAMHWIAESVGYNGDDPEGLVEACKRGSPDTRDEIARLREALEPFAMAASRFDEPSSGVLQWGDSNGFSTRVRLTVGNLRHARAALAPAEPAEGKS